MIPADDPYRTYIGLCAVLKFLHEELKDKLYSSLVIEFVDGLDTWALCDLDERENNDCFWNRFLLSDGPVSESGYDYAFGVASRWVILYASSTINSTTIPSRHAMDSFIELLNKTKPECINENAFRIHTIFEEATKIPCES